MKMLLSVMLLVSANAFAEGHGKAADAHAAAPAAAAADTHHAKAKVDCKKAENAKNEECMKEHHDKK
jgi:invasion protein IalB